jgi:hypothetical protein
MDVICKEFQSPLGEVVKETYLIRKPLMFQSPLGEVVKETCQFFETDMVSIPSRGSGKGDHDLP